MKIVALISQKGGAGKTTLAVHLAVAAELHGHTTAVIDLDPQASASSWRDLRKADTPAVVSAQASRLAQVLATASKHGASVAILDTAPHSEAASLTAAREADLVLIPCRPAFLDLKAIGMTVDLVRLAGTTSCIVLNAVPPRGGLGDDANRALEIYGIPIAQVRVCHRAAYIHALTGGGTATEYEPEGKAAGEIKQLYKWIALQVGL